MLIHLSRFHGSVVLHFGARSSVAAETKNNKNIKKSWTHDNSRQWSRETNKNTTETMLLTKHKENRWPCGMIHNPTRFRFSPKTKTARRGEKKSKSTLILNEFLFSERTTKREQFSSALRETLAISPHLPSKFASSSCRPATWIAESCVSLWNVNDAQVSDIELGVSASGFRAGLGEKERKI